MQSRVETDSPIFPIIHLGSTNKLITTLLFFTERYCLGWCGLLRYFICFHYKSWPYSHPIQHHSWALPWPIWKWYNTVRMELLASLRNPLIGGQKILTWRAENLLLQIMFFWKSWSQALGYLIFQWIKIYNLKRYFIFENKNTFPSLLQWWTTLSWSITLKRDEILWRSWL